MAAIHSLRTRVERLLDERQSSLRQLSIKLGCNNQTLINRLSSPNREKWEDFYERIADALGVTLEQLFTEPLYLEDRRLALDEVREPLVRLLIKVLREPNPKIEESERETAEKTILALTKPTN